MLTKGSSSKLSGEMMANIVFLLLITISGVIASDSHYSSSALSFDQLISDDFKFNDLTSNQTRFTRNADPLSDYSGKLSTVARISNGISLLAGLINKNIPIDTVIEELLHFGNVKLSDVVALQKDKVEAALKELEVAPNDLDSSVAVKNLESETIGMNNLRETYKSVGDFSTYTLPTTYFDTLANFKKDQTDLAVPTKVSTAITDALKSFEDIEKFPQVTMVNYGLAASNILQLDDNLKTVQEAASALQNVVKALDGFGELDTPDKSFKPLIQMLKVLEIRRGIQNTGSSKMQSLIKNMDVVSGLSTVLDAAQTDLKNVVSLITSRLSPLSTKRQHTPAFLNGAADLKKLSKDVRDPSFEATIGGGKNFARLNGGLKPLEAFLVQLQAAEEKLRVTSTAPILSATGTALKLQSLMSEVKVEETAVKTALADVAQCSFVQVAKSDTAPVTQVITLMQDLAKNFAGLRMLAQKLPNFPPPSEVGKYKGILASLPEPFDETSVTKALNDLKTADGDAKKVIQYLKDLQQQLTNAPNGTAIKTMADKIINNKQDIVDFMANTIVVTAVAKLNCLRDVTGPLDKIAQSAQACQLIREFQPQTAIDIRTAVDTITQASPLITDLQKAPADMKKTDEVKKLIDLKDSQKTSATLGSAAASINSMSQLKGMEMTVVQKPTAFDTELAKVTDGSKKSEIQKKWGDHKAFISSLDSTLGQIKDFGAKVSVDKDLRKLGAQLEASKTVADVSQSISDKSEAVGLLILETSDAKAKTELEALQTQLDTLSALDLQFSNHHSAFPAVPAALKSFFDFLIEFLDPSKASANAAAAAADNGTSIWLYVGISVGVVALIVGIGILVFCLLKRNKKNKSEVSKKSEKQKKDKKKKSKDDPDKSSPLRKTSGKEEFVIVDLN